MESRKNFDLWAVIYDFIESRFPWIAKVFFESDSKGCKEESLEESAANTAKLLRKMGKPEADIPRLAIKIARDMKLQEEIKKAASRFSFKAPESLSEARKMNPPTRISEAINILILLLPTLFLFDSIQSVKAIPDLMLAFAHPICVGAVGWLMITRELRLGSKGMRSGLVALLIPSTIWAILNASSLFSNFDFWKAIIGLLQYGFYAHACLLLVKGAEAELWFNPIIQRPQKPKSPDEKIYIYCTEEFDDQIEKFGPFSVSDVRQKVFDGWTIILIKIYHDECKGAKVVFVPIDITAKTLARYESYQSWTTLGKLSGLHVASIFYMITRLLFPSKKSQ